MLGNFHANKTKHSRTCGLCQLSRTLGLPIFSVGIMQGVSRTYAAVLPTFGKLLYKDDVGLSGVMAGL